MEVSDFDNLKNPNITSKSEQKTIKMFYSVWREFLAQSSFKYTDGLFNMILRQISKSRKNRSFVL